VAVYSIFFEISSSPIIIAGAHPAATDGTRCVLHAPLGRRYWAAAGSQEEGHLELRVRLPYLTRTSRTPGNGLENLTSSFHHTAVYA
jgi:hypothetical protein